MLARTASARGPWSVDPGSVDNLGEGANQSAPGASRLVVQANEAGLVVSTDIPESISISAAELDTLEVHFGEFICSMLAGKHVDDPGTP